MRFVPERHQISRAGLVRIVAVTGLSMASLVGLTIGAQEAWRALTQTEVRELIVMEPDRAEWKRRPEVAGGREFLNKGLEINRVQAELFDPPRPEEIILAPPPADF
jgi:hypothetical protein